MFELETVVDERVSAPSLDPAAFDAANQNGRYWSSTLSVKYPVNRWFVDFGLLQPGGYLFTDAMVSLNRVRCVR